MLFKLYLKMDINAQKTFFEENMTKHFDNIEHFIAFCCVATSSSLINTLHTYIYIIKLHVINQLDYASPWYLFRYNFIRT